MSCDRGLALIRQAHVEGWIDLGQADVFDRNWWRKLSWTLDWVEARNLDRLAQLRHELSCAGLVAARSQHEVSQNWEVAVQLQDGLAGRLFPWLDPTLYGQARDVSVRRLTALWTRHFGDRRDPAVECKIQETTAALQRLAAQAARENLT